VAVCDIDAARVRWPWPPARERRHARCAGVCEIVIVAVVDGAQTREVLFGPEGLAATLPRARP